MALDAKWRGIDMTWDFSTIRNNDLLSEATNCQVITFHMWKWTIFRHKWKVLPSNQGFPSIVSAEVISRDALPHKDLVQLASTGPMPPRTNNSLILCTSMLTSLSLCEGKVQSCILLSGTWCINSERDGSSPPPAQACRWAPTPLPFFRVENMVGEEDSIITTPSSICLTTPFALSPSLASSQIMLTAAVYRCPVYFILVSHLFLSHLLMFYFFVTGVHLMTSSAQLHWV